MATLPQPILTYGYTIESLAALLQPHQQEVLYVIDNIMYADANIETCVGVFKRTNMKVRLVEHNNKGPFVYWILMEDSTDDNSTAPLNEWWFFRKDAVDALLAM